MSCTGPNAFNPICRIGEVATSAANDAFSNIAGWFGKAASQATTWLWQEIGSATSVNLDSPQLGTDLFATSAIAVVLSLALFLVQVIMSVLRREPSGLGRAAKGLVVALVASVFALAVTRILLGVVDSLSEGVVSYAMDTNIAGLGTQLAIVNIEGVHNPPATSPNLVRFGRRSSRGLLLGFSAARVACIACAAAVFIPSLLIAGVTGTAATADLWVALLAAAFVPWAGRPLIETAPTAAHFLVRRLQRQTTYAVRPSEPRPAGTLALPGDAAALRWLWHPGTRAVMVHDPHQQTLTAVAHVRHPAYVLLSPDEQSRRVQGWGRALAGLAASGTCARVQILETAQPDSGRGIIDWWQEHRELHGAQWAVQQYEKLMETQAPAACTHRTLVALSLDLKAAGKAIREAGRGMTGSATVLAQDMAAFESGLRAAEQRTPGLGSDASGHRSACGDRRSGRAGQ